jgi:hypothetical protein
MPEKNPIVLDFNSFSKIEIILNNLFHPYHEYPFTSLSVLDCPPRFDLLRDALPVDRWS